MRLISQDKTNDIPYERVAVCLDHDTRCDILAYDTASVVADDYWIMGKYESEERAKEVMNTILIAYISNRARFGFPEH